MEKVLNKNLSCCKNKMAPQFGCTTKKQNLKDIKIIEKTKLYININNQDEGIM